MIIVNDEITNSIVIEELFESEQAQAKPAPRLQGGDCVIWAFVPDRTSLQEIVTPVAV